MGNLKRGYIAFTSAVVISASLLLLATAGSVRGWYMRSNVLDREFKLHSEALADACVEHTLLRLVKDPLFIGPTTTTFEGGVCTVDAVVTAGLQKQFTVRVTYQTAHTNLEVVIDDKFQITSLEEVST